MDETSDIKNDIYTVLGAIDEYYALSSLLGMSVRVGFGSRQFNIAGRIDTPLGTSDYEANIRAICIHDSLAALIVPADKEELALTTLTTDYRSECDFLIAYNGRSPSKVQRHLLRIWRFLSEVYNTEENSVSEAEITMKLRKACYKHCAYRIEKYRDTANRLNLDHFFDEVLKESSPCAILERSYSWTPVIYRDELEYIRGFRSIDEVVDESLRTGDFTVLAIRVKELQETLEAGKLVHPDHSFKSDEISFFFRCGSVAEKYLRTAPGRRLSALALFDLWSNLFSIEQAVRNILDLAFIKKMTRILNFKLRVIFVDMHNHGIHSNPIITDEGSIYKALQRSQVYEPFLTRWAGKMPRYDSTGDKAHSHAECSLLAYIIKNQIRGAYEYIATSETYPCFACKAFVKACYDYCHLTHARFFVREGGEGHRISSPWVFPELGCSPEAELGICTKMLRYASLEFYLVGSRFKNYTEIPVV